MTPFGAMLVTCYIVLHAHRDGAFVVAHILHLFQDYVRYARQRRQVAIHA